MPTLPPAVVELAELPRAPAAEARESEAESSGIVSTALTVGGGVAVVVALGAGGYLALNGGAAGAAGAGANSLPTAKTLVERFDIEPYSDFFQPNEQTL